MSLVSLVVLERSVPAAHVNKDMLERSMTQFFFVDLEFR